MNVHNLMEDVVKSCLKDLMHNQEYLAKLTIEEQSDIIAIALNKLPAKYVSTVKGEVFVKTQLRMQVETDVYRELSNAIDIVMNSDRKSALRGDND
ncbi:MULTISPECIES: late competence development ComFB family protein [unclassified Paenibacillus]|uniref:late competence development ComFB family protein n=1 Tax=unclassified Paenibacillus TaxID=185978 RepID=UPI001AE33720|nr:MULTISPECIES: late competence development ComFB family protein [unclassified Paenibacillus]MBP1156290.1 competence protein ComFB [Paenibacillus sp. PvP091]MBP1168324.1 competence protein ComFB [Paenibacillus sp. PvR098]MBP2439352.1 competence protein ComFB [Paenibacillus sp. PvP052]